MQKCKEERERERSVYWHACVCGGVGVVVFFLIETEQEGPKYLISLSQGETTQKNYFLLFHCNKLWNKNVEIELFLRDYTTNIMYINKYIFRKLSGGPV